MKSFTFRICHSRNKNSACKSTNPEGKKIYIGPVHAQYIAETCQEL